MEEMRSTSPQPTYAISISEEKWVQDATFPLPYVYDNGNDDNRIQMPRRSSEKTH